MKTNSGVGVRALLGLAVVTAAIAGTALVQSPGASSRVEVVAPEPAIVGIAALNASGAAVPVDPGDLASTHATPKYLPAGAEGTGGKTIIYGGWAEHYSLPGKVNSREMPDTPTMPVAGVPSHPATGIDLVELPQTISTFRGTADPRLATVSTITVMGVPAAVLTPNNGYGTYRISWVLNGVAYDLQTDRLKAGGDEGTSGVPLDELIRVAQSIG